MSRKKHAGGRFNRLRLDSKYGGASSSIGPSAWEDKAEYFFHCYKKGRHELVLVIMQKSILKEYRFYRRLFGQKHEILSLDTNVLNAANAAFEVLASRFEKIEFKSHQYIPY